MDYKNKVTPNVVCRGSGSDKKRIDSYTSPTVVRFLCSGRQSLCLQQHGGNMSVDKATLFPVDSLSYLHNIYKYVVENSQQAFEC